MDDKVCYCFHVPLRKLVNFAKREHVRRPSQMSQCLNAGTGCGWCIPVLKKIQILVERGHDFESDETDKELPQSPQEYEGERQDYLKSKERNEF